MAHPNEVMLRKILTAFQAGDVDTVGAHMTEDVVVHVPGTNQISGDYKGPGEFFGSFVATVMKLTDGTFKLNVHDAFAGDEHGTGVYKMQAARDGKTFEWSQVNVYHFRGGKVAEVWVSIHEFEAWNKFFS